MMHRLFLVALLALCCVTLAHAQEPTALAQVLVTLKGGYTDKKRDLEELRVRAYIPFLLKAVGKGPAWKPGHPNWESSERRIATEWRKLYADYMARVGRDTSYIWIDAALAREYARLFSVTELNALLAFYGSDAGIALMALEKTFLDFYPENMLRSLTRVMLGNDALSEREQAAFRSPQNRERREFAVLLESEAILYEESLRIGGAFVAANSSVVQQGALATAADEIDALRQKLDAATLTKVRAFLKTDTAQKEREFLKVAVRTATAAQEDAAVTQQEEAAFYKSLAELSARWRTLAGMDEKSPE